MILVDTSVWVDHLRRGNARLGGLLEATQVSCHPFIVGELACGNLRKRDQILGHLAHLPQVNLASHNEVMELVERRRLMGTGLGWIDAHLLAAALLAGALLWTMDASLAAAARRLHVSAEQ